MTRHFIIPAGRAAALIFAVLLAAGCSRAKPDGTSLNKPSIDLEQMKDGRWAARGTGVPFTGPVHTYFEDGSPHTELHYVNGLQEGAERLFFKDTGLVKREKTWEAGNQVRLREWWSGGQIKNDTAMHGGIAQGWVRMWWENGKLRRSIYMVPHLQPHGQRLEYAEDGTVIWDALFDHGVYISGFGPAADIEFLLREQAGLLNLSAADPARE